MHFIHKGNCRPERFAIDKPLCILRCTKVICQIILLNNQRQNRQPENVTEKKQICREVCRDKALKTISKTVHRKMPEINNALAAFVNRKMFFAVSNSVQLTVAENY